MKLFQLVVESYSSLQLEVPSRKSLISLRDELTAGQAKLLGYLVENGKDGSEIAQRQIEQGMGYPHASAELYYRLESLIQQGFAQKRRIATDGQFSYALTEEFRSQMGKHSLQPTPYRLRSFVPPASGCRSPPDLKRESGPTMRNG